MGVMRLLLVLGGLVGCDDVFNLHRPDPTKAPAGCSSMRMFRDDFEDGHFGPWGYSVYMTDPAITVAESGGALEMQLGVEGIARATMTHFLDLRQSSLAVEVSDDGPAGVREALELVSEVSSPIGQAQNKLIIERRGASLLFRVASAAQQSTVGMIDYDPVQHRFWKIARVGDDTIWSTSPDGTTYVEQARAMGLDWVTYMYVALETQREGAVPPFSAFFDEINTLEPEPTALACPASSLVDDFSSETIEPRWGNSYQVGCSLAAEGGALTFVPAVGRANACRLSASTVYDLRDHAIAVEISEMLSATETTTGAYFTVSTLAGDNVTLRWSSGAISVTADVETGFVMLDSRPYDPELHRWLRVRADKQTVFAEASPDGTAWELLGSTSSVRGIDLVLAWLEIVGYPSSATPLRLEGVNTAP